MFETPFMYTWDHHTEGERRVQHEYDGEGAALEDILKPEALVDGSFKNQL